MQIETWVTYTKIKYKPRTGYPYSPIVYYNIGSPADILTVDKLGKV